MDLKLTTTSLEIMHGTHKEILAVLEALQIILPNNPFVQKYKESKVDYSRSKQLQEQIRETKEVVIPLSQLSDLNVNFKETVDKVVSHSIPRKRLVFDTCEKCENTFCQLVEISDSDLRVLAPIVHCKCGHSQLASDLTKGKYTCDCGFEGHFWMTPNVNSVKCKSCGQFHTMVKSADTGEYENYRELNVEVTE